MCDVDQQLRKLIQILSIALRCGNLTLDETQFTNNIQNVLEAVLKNNLTAVSQNQSQDPDPSIVTGLNFNFGGNEGNGSSIQSSVNRSSGVSLFSAFSPFAKYFPIAQPTTSASSPSGFGFGFGNANVTDSDVALIIPYANGNTTTLVNFSGGYGTGINLPAGGGSDGIEITKIAGAAAGHRLHRLEIIKVVVLIVVISIILISTCRMVLQLFLRFRPEKNNDYI